MTTDTIHRIATERLARWQRLLEAGHATPAVLVGFGHDHASGTPVVCTCEEVTDAELIVMLRGAADLIERGGHS